jgi:hypothetical protein
MREPNYTFRTRVARLGRTAWAGVRSAGDEAERLVSCSVDHAAGNAALAAHFHPRTAPERHPKPSSATFHYRAAARPGL